MIRMLKGYLRPLVSVQARRAIRRAKEAFSREHPKLTHGDAIIRAEEDDCTVVAVFYQDPGRPCKPSPYKLYSVPLADGSPAEMTVSRDSPYLIKGRR
jgi:hypothetical protein